MVLLSKLVMLLKGNVSGSSGDGSGGSSGGSATPGIPVLAGCELVVVVVERLLASLEQLYELCSRPDSEASAVQQAWQSHVAEQSGLPGGSVVAQLLQQLAA